MNFSTSHPAIITLSSHYPVFFPVDDFSLPFTCVILHEEHLKRTLVRTSPLKHPTIYISHIRNNIRVIYTASECDFLFICITLTSRCWLIPFSDLPHLRTIHMSQKYDSYLLSHLVDYSSSSSISPIEPDDFSLINIAQNVLEMKLKAKKQTKKDLQKTDLEIESLLNNNRYKLEKGVL